MVIKTMHTSTQRVLCSSQRVLAAGTSPDKSASLLQQSEGMGISAQNLRLQMCMLKITDEYTTTSLNI